MKRGVALLWVLVLSTVLLIIAGTMVGYITKESRFSVRIEDSTKAYAAARSGIEWARYELNRDPSKRTEGVKQKIIMDDCGDPGAPCVYAEVEINDTVINGVTSAKTESTGVSGVVRRKLDYDILDKLGFDVVPKDLATSKDIVKEVEPTRYLNSNPNSYSFQFDFWRQSSTQPFAFGLSSKNGDESIRMEVSGTGEAYLRANSGGIQVGSKSVNSNIYSGIAIDKSYNYRAEITYINDTAASLKIKAKRTGVGATGFDCIGYGTIDLSNKSFDLVNLFITGGSTVFTSGSAMGDGTLIEVGGNPSKIFIDNMVFRGSTANFGTTPPVVPSLPMATSFSAVTVGTTTTVSWVTTGAVSGSLIRTDTKAVLVSSVTLPSGSFVMTAPPASIPISLVLVNEVGTVTSSSTIEPTAGTAIIAATGVQGQFIINLTNVSLVNNYRINYGLPAKTAPPTCSTTEYGITNGANVINSQKFIVNSCGNNAVGDSFTYKAFVEVIEPSGQVIKSNVLTFTFKVTNL